MLIRVTCESCHFTFKVSARFAGKRGRCPNPECGARYIVPATTDPAPAETSDSADHSDRPHADESRTASRSASASQKTRPRRPAENRTETASPKATSAKQTSTGQTTRRAGSRTQSAAGRRARVASATGSRAASGSSPEQTATARSWIRQRLSSRLTWGVSGASLALMCLLLMVAATFRSGPKTSHAAQEPEAAATTPQQAAERQATRTAAIVADYNQHVKPFLQKYCIDCHDIESQEAGLAFDKLPPSADSTHDREVWKKTLAMLEVGAMPPADHDPQPAKAELDRVISWIGDSLLPVDCEIVRDPGRVTIRRLNRAEYNNTIRDLVGVDFRPADDFPSDDVGYGFDNIGDVLSLPPLLLEKYLDAAEQITAKAIIPDPDALRKQHFPVAELQSGNASRRNGELWLNSSGSITAPIRVRTEGRYALRAEALATQAGPDLAKLEFRIDGKKVDTVEVRGHRKRGVYEVTAKVPRGAKRLEAAFVNDYYMPEAKNPNQRDRNLGVVWLELEGPLGVEDGGLPESHRRLITARPDKDRSVEDAAEQVLKPFATRAFRRPVTIDELQSFVRLVKFVVDQEETYERGIQVAVQAILVSPHFLFRIETDRQPDNPDAVHEVTDYQLASRLSYFLWSSMPDQELFDLASRGELRQPEVLRKQVQRMLADDRATALVDNFASQWLNLRMLDEHEPDKTTFKQFSDELKQDMRRETELFFEEVMRKDRSILDFLTARYTFVNERLANHYGMPGVKGNNFRRVELTGNRRIGVLTHASILTLTAYPTRTSPVIRGKWILENILGTPPPPPPPDVPVLEVAQQESPEASLREQLVLHRTDPNCASCHKVMDPLGFGFENFDAIGRWREKDGKHPIDASGELPGGAKFSGPVELVNLLIKRQDDFARALSEKMLTYALGRGLEHYDQCAVQEIARTLKQDDYRFSTLVLEIVQSDPFLKRRGDDGGQP